METDRWVRSTCGLCRAGCGVLLHLENGKLTGVEGDLDSPLTKGALCPLGSASPEFLYSRLRLKHPLKRVGERGQDKWQQVTWDKALNQIASEFIKARDNYGAESVQMVRSAARGLPDDYFQGFAHAFGTPNVATPWYVCHTPTTTASQMTFGGYHLPDYEYPPACIIAWGSNVRNTDAPKYLFTSRALDKGAKLIVIDPMEIDFAKRADVWLQVRPGSDLALALGMINVIVNENLYDKSFINNWTVGFDQLMAHVQDYPPEKVADITWIDAEAIRIAARFYATNRPAAIEIGNAIEHNVNSFQTARAICILESITGNLEIPGGKVEQQVSPGMIARGSAVFPPRSAIPADKRKQRIGSEEGLLPMLDSALPQGIVKSILKRDPYPIHVVYIQGSNLLLNWSNTWETHEALKKLDFIAVADLFMTPTAAMADIVLPVASYLEYDSVAIAPSLRIARIQTKVAEIGECWSDYKILSELAKRIGLDQWHADYSEAFLDSVLQPSNITFNELRKIGVVPAWQPYRRYQANGFETPSRKVELYSSLLEKWGFDPLPIYNEQPETPYSDPELAKEYPLILTSCKSGYYRHSSGRQIPSLRNRHPDPIVEIHPDTASKLGIKEDNWVYIENRRGKIKQRARLLTGIDPRVVRVDYGWWFPERAGKDLFGFAESNVNVLTDNKPPFSREMGSANLRGILCKIYKVP